jgi:uncharacterized protein (TIGR02266 family)
VGLLHALFFRAKRQDPREIRFDGNAAYDAERKPDRREHARVRLQLQVRLRFASAEALVACRTFDVSEGGAFLMLDTPRPVGTEVRLVLDVGERTLVLGGVVARCSDGRDGRPGMGIRFVEVSADDQAFLATLIDSA